MGTAATVRKRVGSASGRMRPLAAATMQALRELSLATYASAIAFRALVVLVPLTLLGLGLLGAFGLRDVWDDSFAPAIRKRVTPEVFTGIDSSVAKILESGTAGLIVFAAALALWHLTMAMRVTTVALNKIHRLEESRPLGRRIAVSIGLALAVAGCLVASMLVVLVAGRVGEGALHYVLVTGRWAVAVALLGLAVGLVVRYAPSEQPEARWASAGSALIVGTWLLASLAFGWYVSSIADFTSAIGSLTVFLVLTAYVFTTSAIFLIGVQIDELLRNEGRP